MITENELRNAIAECQGESNPNANTCIKMASYLIILDHLFTLPSGRSKASGIIEAEGHSEFIQAVNGKDFQKVISVLDGIMNTIQIVKPQLYDSTIRKIQGL